MTIPGASDLDLLHFGDLLRGLLLRKRIGVIPTTFLTVRQRQTPKPPSDFCETKRECCYGIRDYEPSPVTSRALVDIAMIKDDLDFQYYTNDSAHYELFTGPE